MFLEKTPFSVVTVYVNNWRCLHWLAFSRVHKRRNENVYDGVLGIRKSVGEVFSKILCLKTESMNAYMFLRLGAKQRETPEVGGSNPKTTYSGTGEPD